MSKQLQGPSVTDEAQSRNRQTEYPAQVGIDLATGEIFCDNAKRTRVREVPQPNVVIDGGVTKDQPAQPLR